MNKNFKFLFGALGLLTLASCSSDDLFGTGEAKADLSDKVVMYATVAEDGGGMRAFKEQDGGTFTWVDGDKLRAYDNVMQKYDEFVVKDGILQITKAEAQVAPEDYAYVLFAEEGQISFAGWNDGKNLALVRLGYELDNAGKPVEGITYKQTTATRAADGQEVVVYKSALPMYGIPTSAEVGKPGEPSKVDVELNRLTAQARVEFENGTASGVKAVRARSLTLKEGVELTEEETALLAKLTVSNSEYLGTKISDLAVLNDSHYDKNDATPMSGWFQANLYADPAKAAESKIQPVSDNTGAINTEINKPEITVNVPAQSMEASYDNVVFVPIVSQLYELLVIEYQNANDEWIFLGARQNATPTGSVAGMKVTTVMEREAATLIDLQKIINEAAALGRDITVNVAFTTSGGIVVSNSQDAGTYKLTLPANLTKEVTLNISENGNNYIKNAADDTKTLEIVSDGATGKLALNGIKYIVPVDLNVGETTLALSSTTLTRNVNVLSAKALQLGNVTLDMVADQTLNFGDTPLLINGKVENSTSGVKVTAIETEGDVEVTEEADVQVGITAANVTVNGVCSNTNTTITASGDVVVNEKGSVQTIKAEGDVTINKGKVWRNITAGGNVTIKNVATTFGSYSGVVTMTGENKTIEFDAKGATIKKLVLDAATTVTLKNGIITEITANEGAETSTVYSEGSSSIGDITGEVASVKSKWTEGTEPTGSTDGSGTNKIYTVANLLSFKENAPFSKITGAIVMADELDFDNNAWDGIDAKTPLNTDGFSFTGGLEDKTPVIKNVKLTGKGFINGSADGNKRLETLTVKNLQFENIYFATPESEDDDITVTNGHGLLMGTLSMKEPHKTATIENIVIKQGAVKGDDEAFDLGGLIGVVEIGTVTITKTSVTAEIEGYYNLGGIIGRAGRIDGATKNRAEATVTFGNEYNVSADGVKAPGTTIKVVREMDDDGEVYAGRVALAVGVLEYASLNLPYFSVTPWPTAEEVNTNWKYDKCVDYVTKDNNKKHIVFKGCLNGKTPRYYVGYSPTAWSFFLQDKEMKKGFDGTTFDENGTYNVFVQK